MNPLSQAWWLAKGVGWDNLPRRLLQQVRVRTGVLRRRLDPAGFSEAAFRQACPSGPADEPAHWRRRAALLPAAPPDALRRLAAPAAWDRHVTEVCRRALDGQYRHFSRWYGRLGWPPDFTLDPVHRAPWPRADHWLRIIRSPPVPHDVKLVWESCRLSLAYYFARAAVRDGDARWADAFWTLLEAWLEQNPPEQSVAWGCGQEMAFRLMAACFAAGATLDAPAATPERLHALTRLAWQSGRHIAININQARMQGNNHGISEAVGLWTVGTLFPELAEAGRWRRHGLRVLADEVGRQVYDDGSYVQHSTNYHRVLLDDLLWASALARRGGQPLPAVVPDRLGRAAAWLVEMMDPATGRVPNYGANDGALVLPLAACDYADFRPVVQAAHYAARGERCLEPGPWDEKMAWLFGPQSLGAPVRRPEHRAAFAAPDGGYYVLRGPASWAMTRCHTYRHRPSQADMLHLDLWYRGVNVLRDAGSYLYACEAPWRRYFASTAAHNTVEVDGKDQMIKGPRFVWFRWTHARLIRFETSTDGRVGYVEGRQEGYRRLPGRPVHRRSILRVDDAYLAIDDVLGQGTHTLTARWRLAEADWQPRADAWRAEVGGDGFELAAWGPDGLDLDLYRGRQKPRPEGWASRYYGQREPAPTVVATVRAALPVRLVTRIGPADSPLEPASAPPAPDGPLVLATLPDPGLAAIVEQVSGGRIRHG